MIDLTGLLTPFLFGLSLLTVMTVTDLQSTYIASIAVPDDLNKSGYSSEVISRVISDNMVKIETRAQTRAELRRLKIETERTVLGAVIDYVNLTPVVRSFQKSSGLLEFYVTGEVVDLGSDYRMRLRFERHRRAWRTLDVEKPKAQVDAFLQAVAEAIVKVTDPQIQCSALLRDALGAAAPDFTAARACIDETLPYAEPEDRPWLINLGGVLDFLRGDRQTALAWFRAAGTENPDFSPALVNRAVLHYLDGDYQMAIQRCQEVFRKRLPSDSPQTYAAAHTQWALALFRLGRYAEAEEKFKNAEADDPRFANVYYDWSEVERERGNIARADELLAQGRRISREEPIYVENLIGHIYDLGAKAAARR